MLTFRLKQDFDHAALETGSLCLGFSEITLLANIGPFPQGGDCLIVRCDGANMNINSNDLVHDLEAYEILILD